MLLQQEDEPAARPQQPRCFGDPAVRIDPDAGAVLRDDEIEALVGKPRRGGVGLEQGELEPVLALQLARRLELRRRHVDADRPGAAASQPRRDVRGAAAELEHVRAVQLDPGERAQLGLGNAPDPPADLLLRPRPPALLVGVLRVRLRPELAVPRRFRSQSPTLG